jgi:hypothetical protein
VPVNTNTTHPSSTNQSGTSYHDHERVAVHRAHRTRKSVLHCLAEASGKYEPQGVRRRGRQGNRVRREAAAGARARSAAAARAAGRGNRSPPVEFVATYHRHVSLCESPFDWAREDWAWGPNLARVVRHGQEVASRRGSEVRAPPVEFVATSQHHVSLCVSIASQQQNACTN